MGLPLQMVSQKIPLLSFLWFYYLSKECLNSMVAEFLIIQFLSRHWGEAHIVTCVSQTIQPGLLHRHILAVFIGEIMIKTKSEAIDSCLPGYWLYNTDFIRLDSAHLRHLATWNSRGNKHPIRTPRKVQILDCSQTQQFLYHCNLK